MAVFYVTISILDNEDAVIHMILLTLIPLFAALKNVAMKVGLKEKDSGVDPYSLLVVIHGIGIVLVLLFGAFAPWGWAQIVPPTELSREFLTALAIKTPLQVVALVSLLYALRHSLSFSMPLLLLTPVFVPLCGVLIIGPSQLPDASGWVGIILIIVGAYLLNGSVMAQGVLAPLKELVRHRASLLMLTTAMLWSITSIFDKIGAHAATPLSWVLYTYSAVFVAVLLLGALLYGVPRLRSVIDFMPRRSWRNLRTHSLLPALVLAGVLEMAMETTQMYAVTVITVAYVIAAKRVSVLIDIAAGGLLFDEQHYRKAFMPAIIMLAGLFIILS